MKRSLKVNNHVKHEYKGIFSDEALGFVEAMANEFGPRLQKLLKLREARQKLFDSGSKPKFLSETHEVRQSEWKVAQLPADLLKRHVEITGPTERKMIINALNCGADVFMADCEDSSSPTWENVVQGQINLFDAVRRKIAYLDPAKSKQYNLNEESKTTLMVRPRGLHLKENGISVRGEPIPASFFDFGLYFFHNAKELIDRGSGPYFYLPKLESHLEARLWNDVFSWSQSQLEIKNGTIKATVLIETLPAAFEMDEILFELKSHSAGLNCGRWDYIFSYIKTFRNHSEFIMPDRSEVGMTQPFMEAYCKRLVRVCHRRGVHAMGGMAAQIPIKNDPEANALAMEKVRADKLREVNNGHDGTWVAHPGLISIVREVFSTVKTDNQLEKPLENLSITEEDLIELPDGAKTLSSLRHNISVGVQYLASWLNGQGCVPLYNLMEDAATAEISRSQVWQWLKHGAVMSDGTPMTKALFLENLRSVEKELKETVGSEIFGRDKYAQAIKLFEELTLSESLENFCTLKAYSMLSNRGAAMAVKVNSEHKNRFDGVSRAYSQEEVESLRPSKANDYTYARFAAEKLWRLMHSEAYVPALGAVTGNQAVQMAKGGLQAVYCSGWQVAADANLAAETYPDQSLYPANSVPALVKRLNQALTRAEQVDRVEGKNTKDYMLPIVADAEAGFGGALNAFELMKSMIEAGAAGVHFEDQLSSEKKCGHLGGKVLVPMQQFERTLSAARLAADVMNVPTILIARTDANSANLLTSDIDDRDKKFVTGKRTPEGFFEIKGGIEYATARGLAFAPHADLLWCETSTPDLEEAKYFAEKVHLKFPGKLLAYNCSPSFNWKKHLDDATIAKFQRELGAMGYKFQFITLAGFHSLNYAMFELALDYKERGMTAYSKLQEAEFASEAKGYTATKHQREVGTGYFDQVNQVLTGGNSSTLALKGSTEEEQF